MVTLALEPDMTRLVDAGLVAKDWDADEHKGMITNSEVIEPNPFTSGGAKSTTWCPTAPS